MEWMQYVSQGLSLIIQAGTVIGLIYAWIKFADKGNISQNERLAALETWKEHVDARLSHGDDNFVQNREANRVMLEALLALLSHAIDGNDVEELKKAKKTLNNYLLEK